jgi:hypothetical protein
MSGVPPRRSRSNTPLNVIAQLPSSLPAIRRLGLDRRQFRVRHANGLCQSSCIQPSPGSQPGEHPCEIRHVVVLQVPVAIVSTAQREPGTHPDPEGCPRNIPAGVAVTVLAAVEPGAAGAWWSRVLWWPGDGFGGRVQVGGGCWSGSDVLGDVRGSEVFAGGAAGLVEFGFRVGGGHVAWREYGEVAVGEHGGAAVAVFAEPGGVLLAGGFDAGYGFAVGAAAEGAFGAVVVLGDGGWFPVVLSIQWAMASLVTVGR